MYEFEQEIAQLDKVMDVLSELNIRTPEITDAQRAWRGKVARLVKVNALLGEDCVIDLAQRQSTLQNNWFYLMRWYGSHLARYVDGEVTAEDKLVVHVIDKQEDIFEPEPNVFEPEEMLVSITEEKCDFCARTISGTPHHVKAITLAKGELNFDTVCAECHKLAEHFICLRCANPMRPHNPSGWCKSHKCSVASHENANTGLVHVRCERPYPQTKVDGLLSLRMLIAAEAPARTVRIQKAVSK
jgi:hypothetical protein